MWFALVYCWLAFATFHKSHGLLLRKLKHARVVSEVQWLQLARLLWVAYSMHVNDESTGFTDTALTYSLECLTSSCGLVGAYLSKL